MASTFNISNVPAMVPPPGQTSNFVDPVNLHPAVLSVGIVTMTLMTIALTVRIYTKAIVLKDMRIEEYFAIVATVGVIFWDSVFIHVSVNGFSRHLWDVRFVDVPNLSYMSYLAEITNAPTMFFAKCSILFQFKRLFCTGQTRDSTFWSIHGLLFLCAAYYTSAIFTFVFQCIPREKTWNPLKEGHCIDVAAAIVVQGAINVFLDVGILIVPLWAIWRLQLPMKRKFGISAIFGVGILTCAIAAVGVVFRIPLLSDGDLTWLITKVGIWTMVEYCGTIIVGCMPSFPRFFLHIRGQEPRSAGFSSSASWGNTGSNPGRPGGQQPYPTNNSHHRQTANAPSYHSRNKSVTTVGMALSTSEVSFPDSAYIELERGGGATAYSRAESHHSHSRRPSDETTTNEGCGDRDWSPLSSPSPK